MDFVIKNNFYLFQTLEILDFDVSFENLILKERKDLVSNLDILDFAQLYLFILCCSLLLNFDR